MLRLQGRLRLEHIEAIDTGFAMHVFGGHEFALHGPVATGIDWRPLHAGDVAHHAGIALCQLERHVARDRRDAQYFEFSRRSKRQQQRHGVVLARIAVENNLALSHELKTSA